MWEGAYYSNISNLKEKMFSIQQDSNGNKYVEVDTNQNIFERKNLSEQNKIAKKYILDNFRENGIDVNNENINVTSKTANEYTHPKRELNKKDMSSKLRASTELDNLLSASEYKYSRPDDGRHNIAKDGWDYYKVNFKVGNKTFEGLINIAKNGKRKTLYDITQIKKTLLVGLDYMSSTTRAMSSYANNIPQSNTNVKSDTSSTTKYSILINKNNTHFYHL